MRDEPTKWEMGPERRNRIISIVVTAGIAFLVGMLIGVWLPGTTTTSTTSMKKEAQPEYCNSGVPVRTAEGDQACLNLNEYQQLVRQAEAKMSQHLERGKLDITTMLGELPEQDGQEEYFTSYLCSEDTTGDGRMFAAGQLSDETETTTVEIDGLRVKVARPARARVARELCDPIPGWAIPTPTPVPKEKSKDTPRPSNPPTPVPSSYDDNPASDG